MIGGTETCAVHGAMKVFVGMVKGHREAGNDNRISFAVLVHRISGRRCPFDKLLARAKRSRRSLLASFAGVPSSSASTRVHI